MTTTKKTKTSATSRKPKAYPPKVTAEFEARRELITPQIAERYLEKLPEFQRRLRKKDVDRYSVAMKAGHWKLTGEAIKFNTSGDLIDGQHRLRAVAQSGTTILCEVQRNVPDDAFMELDTGVGRSPGDLLKIAGYDYTNGVAATIRHLTSIYEIEAGKVAPSSLAKRKCPPDLLLEYAKAHSDALVSAVRATMNKEARQVCSPPALFASLYFIFNEYNKKGAEVFFQTLIEGIGFERGREDPVYLLRKFLLDLKTSKHKHRPNFYKVAVIIKAWNAFQERESMSTLRFSENEAWPEINRRRSRIREDVAATRDRKRKDAAARGGTRRMSKKKTTTTKKKDQSRAA